MRGSSRALGANQPQGLHVLSWMRERGHLTLPQYEGALHHAQRTGQRAEEALLETGAYSEAELLKLLAERYATQFVSTERLSKANIDRATLAYIPRKLAERLQAFPVVFERRHQRLSIVLAAPGESDAEKQVQVVSGVREVRCLVARPDAIAAAIEKFYVGNHRAFLSLKTYDATSSISIKDMSQGTGSNDFEVYDPNPLGDLTGGQSGGETTDFADPFASLIGPTFDAPDAAAPPVIDYGQARSPAPKPTPAIQLDGVIPGGLPNDPTAIEFDGFLETLNVFVSLLERQNDEVRGHSALVARLCQKVAARVGINDADRRALAVAAYLHDIGKSTSNYHLTALNVAKYEGHRTQAARSRLAAIRLFETAPIPEGTEKILAHLYERFDGQGFPDRLAQKDIPYGSRVLAIVETYCDLIGNKRNPYRKLLSAPEALSVLRKLGGQLFDPTLAELLVRLAVGDNDRDALGNGPRALVVDPDPEETTVLEMRLIEHGFVVRVAHDIRSAREALNDSVDLVLTEVDFPGESNGFDLLEHIQTLPEDGRPEVIFLTARGDRNSVTRGFDLGAADYLVKPASADVVATKAGQAVEGAVRKRVGGVSGSLKEMSLPDVIQILSNGKRGGKLQLVAGGRRGEIHFSDGQVVDAEFGNQKAEEAVYAMLKLSDGTFSLDPTFKPGERVINSSAEGLLLEGMRRIDEGIT